MFNNEECTKTSVSLSKEHTNFTRKIILNYEYSSVKIISYSDLGSLSPRHLPARKILISELEPQAYR